MFSKKYNRQKSNGPVAEAVPSIISADLSIKGDLVTEGEIHLDGRLVGDLTCREVTVGPGAYIEGEVTAKVIRVFGEIKGRLRAEIVEIASDGRVQGDVLHRMLKIENGATIDGLCRHMENPRDLPVAQLVSSSSSGASAEVVTLSAKPNI